MQPSSSQQTSGGGPHNFGTVGGNPSQPQSGHQINHHMMGNSASVGIGDHQMIGNGGASGVSMGGGNGGQNTANLFEIKKRSIDFF